MVDTEPTEALQLAADAHPAKWSQPVLDVLAEYVQAEADLHQRRLRVLDPFAGVGRLRLFAALGSASVIEVVGAELQPEWGDEGTLQADATNLPADWSAVFDVVATSPCYGNRMADHHDAADRCKDCEGTRHTTMPDDVKRCPTCKGTRLSWRNTYAHALRRQGGDLIPGSAAGIQWGMRYRDLHKLAIIEMVRCTTEGGLLLVNMSNHVRAGQEELVVEWWVNELLYRGCNIVEVRRVQTRRQRHGANGEARVDGEVVIAVRTPSVRTLL